MRLTSRKREKLGFVRRCKLLEHGRAVELGHVRIGDDCESMCRTVLAEQVGQVC